MAMTNPSVNELLKQAENRYALVVKVSKRARQLVSGAEPLFYAAEGKPVSIASQEVNRGYIDHSSLNEEEK